MTKCLHNIGEQRIGVGIVLCLVAGNIGTNRKRRTYGTIINHISKTDIYTLTLHDGLQLSVLNMYVVDFSDVSLATC